MLERLRAGQLAGSKRLNLSCGLREFPREIFNLADTLEILDLSGNALSSLPDDLPRLHKLRILFCSNNLFTALPEILGQCPQLSMVGFKANRIHTVPAAAIPPALRWLILTDNNIAELPAGIGRCTQLQKLMLAGNQLQTLPPELAGCTKLELLRISANRFTALPDWLFELPQLAWLAYADNPFCDENEDAALAHTSISHIDWEKLQIQQKLGEGASGEIYQALWRREECDQHVAVKIFKGALTSDGLPHSEIAACICAGEHPNLISMHGKISGHPSKTNALVLALMDARFRNLAAPPSLESCTRDIYPDDTAFTLRSAIRIAQGIAAVARHLHERGIMHGDLYAHNIMYGEQGEAILGDFGAASFFDTGNLRQAEALQRIEVRAFGCLLEELIARCNMPSDSLHLLHQLVDLQERCAQEKITVRPLFAEIHQVLENLQVDLTAGDAI